MRNRRFEDFSNSICPDSTLFNIRTLERTDIDHRRCVLGGQMRNLNRSIEWVKRSRFYLM